MDDEIVNAVECLVSLLYLIRLRASVAADVVTFVDMTEKPLQTLVDAARKNHAVTPTETP